MKRAGDINMMVDISCFLGILKEKEECMMNAAEFLREAQKNEEVLKAHRRFLHEHAETGFDITETKEYVRRELEKMGYAPQECGRAGLVACVGGRQKGKVFLLRADMDALPVTEQTGLPYACKEGRMHACGHDMHTSMLLGAAKLLKEHEDEIQGTVKLMFEPAEEILSGAADMIDAGVLENPQTDAALMIHVMAGMPVPTGTVIVCDGGISAPSADMFTIKIQGKGCHGSMPQNGIDPVTVSAHLVLALQEITARELSISEPAILTIGSVQAGNSYNAIPDSAVLMGSMRTFDEEVRARMKQRIEQIAESVAVTYRAEAETSFDSGCPCLDNSAVLSQAVTGYAKELLGEEKAVTQSEFAERAGGRVNRLAGGSEDFASVSQRVPSIMLALAAGEPDKGYRYPQHHPQVDFDEAVLAPGSAVYAYLALRWLEDSMNQ